MKQVRCFSGLLTFFHYNTFTNNNKQTKLTDCIFLLYFIMGHILPATFIILFSGSIELKTRFDNEFEVNQDNTERLKIHPLLTCKDYWVAVVLNSVLSTIQVSTIVKSDFWCLLLPCNHYITANKPLFWSERSACDSGANLGRPLFPFYFLCRI